MFFDKPETQQRLSDTGALGEPSTFAERTIAAFKSTQDRNFGVVNGGAMLDAYEARRKAVMDAVGEDIGNPFTQAMNQLPPMGDANGYGMPGPLPELKPRGQMEADFQSALERLAEKHPDKRDIIAPHKPVRSTFASEVREREQKSIDAGRNYGGITGTGPIADFAGVMGSQVTDPVNAATILIGPTGRVGQGAKAIIGMGVKQGIANAGVEAAMAPLVQDFRRQMGQSYGLGEAAYDIGTAAALGFAADAGIRTAARRIQSKLGRKAILDVDGNVTGYEPAEASIARATRQAESQARAEQLKALQDDGTLQRAMDGDPEAIAKVDPILGLSEDPAVRGARQVQEFVELEPGDFDDIAKSRTFNQALRAAIDADEPPPVIKMERASNRPSLSDDMEIPKGTEGNQHFRTIDIEGKPVHFQNLDPKKITTDAEAMQFKSGGNQFGVTGALGINTTFDPAAAGKVIVFERADGVTIIVDGHQRLSIAKDGDQFQGFVFREADGWSAADVRAEAALKNIQEGRANLLDTVSAMREHGPQMEGRIAVDTDFMRQAVGMSRLSDAAFVRLEVGTIEPHMAALVGELVPDQTKHDGVVQALMRANPATEAAARKIIGREIREPVSADELSQVMGASVAEPHVIEARTDVLAGVIGTLRGEPGYIGDVETQAVAKVISRLADRPGLVADTLNQAGRAVAEGQPLERAIDATLRRFEQVIAEAGVKGLADQPIKLAPEKTATGIKISDFANKVNALKEKYGIGAEPTRSINAEDAVVLPDGQPRFLASLAPVEKSVGDLKAQLQEIKNGSRIVVVKKFADEFVASAKEIVAATEELKAIDVLDATHAELTQLEAATADLQKIVDRKLQDGYNSTEQVETARDYLSKAFEDLQAKYLDEVWRRASHIESKVADFNQDIMSRLESRLSEEKIDAIKDDVFTFERELLPAIRDPDTFPKDYSVLDIIKQDFDQVSSALKQMSDRLDEIVAKTDLDALDDVGLVRVLDETGDIENAIERFQERSDKMEDLSSDHAMGIYDAVEKINDDQVRPAVDDLEYAQSDIADIVGDIADRRAELAEETPTRLASLSDVDTGRSMRQIEVTAKDGGVEARIAELPRVDPLMLPKGNESVTAKLGDTVMTYSRVVGQDKALYIEEIATKGEGSGKGNARALLQGLAEQADVHGMTIDLLAQPGTRTTDLRRLVRLYESIGFVATSQTEHSVEMIRLPLSNAINQAIRDASEEPARLFALSDISTGRSMRADLDALGYYSQALEVAKGQQAPDMAALKSFTENLEAVLKDAQKPSPPRLVDDVTGKDGKAHLEDLRETMAQEIKEVVDPATAQAKMLSSVPGIDPSKPLLYTAKANELQAEIRKEIDRTLQMLPPDVRIRAEDELVFNLNGGSDARIAGLWDGYDRLVYVALSGNDPVRAVRHEVIHALKQSGLLTADEFKQLYAFSETLKLRGAYKVDERYRDLYTKAYGERGGDYVENLLREETIAEMFADYSLNGRRFGDVAGGGLVDRLIDRIVSFMKLLRDNLGFLDFRNVNDIFQAIESGEVASRPSSRNPSGARNPDVVARQIGDAMGGERLASDPLDLSPEARKARAEQMGFDTSKVWYHGSDAVFDSFESSALGTNTGARSARKAIFFANNRYVAGFYPTMTKEDFDAVASGGFNGDYPIPATEIANRYKSIRDKYQSTFNSPDMPKAERTAIHAEFDQASKVWRESADYKKWKADKDQAEKSAFESGPFGRAKLLRDELRDALDGDARMAYQIETVAVDGMRDASSVGVIRNAMDTLLRAEYPDAIKFVTDNAERMIEAFKAERAYKDIYAKSSRDWSGSSLDDAWNTLKADAKPNIRQVYTSADNLLVHDYKGQYRDKTFAELIVQAENEGRDGALFLNVADPYHGDVLAVFDPAKVRSVNAEFDPAKTGSANLLASMEGQRPSEMLDQALAALPEETSTAIRTVLKQANIDEAQLGPMLDSLMPLIRSGDQAAFAERVQAMAKEADPVMMPPRTEFGRALAELQADREMIDVIGACRA